MKIFYSPSYTIAAHSFETTRKSRWIAESLAAEPIGGIELVAPEPTSAAPLSRVHDPAYVDAVRNGSEKTDLLDFRAVGDKWPIVHEWFRFRDKMED